MRIGVMRYGTLHRNAGADDRLDIAGVMLVAPRISITSALLVAKRAGISRPAWLGRDVEKLQ